MASLTPSQLVTDPQMDPLALHKYMVFNEEVQNALATKRPIVALESTGTLLSSTRHRFYRTLLSVTSVFTS